MKVLTEAKVRAEVPRSEHPEVYYIEPGYILSPAAREYLMGRQIKISNGPKPGEESETVTAADEVPPMPAVLLPPPPLCPYRGGPLLPF